MAKENKNRDDMNSNDTLSTDTATGSTTSTETTGEYCQFPILCNFPVEFFVLFTICVFFLLPFIHFADNRNVSEPPKENPFSFKHFLRRDPTSTTTGSINQINGNDSTSTTASHTSSSSLTQNNSSSTSNHSISSTGARPKVFFQNDSVKMKRSPKFSSFDSQSSLSELAEERQNMHSSRSNNSFNLDYPFPSSRSYSAYDSIETTSNERKTTPQHTARRASNNVNGSSNLVLPDFVQDHFLDYYNSDSPSANMSPLSGDDFSLAGVHNGEHNGGDGMKNGLNRSPNCRRRLDQIPLDLPTIGSRPLNLGEANNVQREETYGPHNEPEMQRDQAAIDKKQKLPDFLSDGPIHSSGRLADVASVNMNEDNQSVIMRLQQENDRLRMELDDNRRLIVDLESQISHAKNLETQYNVTLAESMEQVEENLLATNQKAAEAQAQANKYKQQVKQLMVSCREFWSFYVFHQLISRL